MQITIPIYEYRDLVTALERIEALKRLFETSEYITMEEVKAVLSIKDGDQNGNFR